jgi:putative ABC transport system permease protein
MPGNPRSAVIVGVVADIRYSGLESEPSGAVYVPFRQRPLASAYIAARTEGPVPNLSADLIRHVRAIDPAQTVAEIRLLSDFRDEPIAEPRARTAFAGSGAALALIVAAAGVYGLVAYTVSQRTREIGIRMAIGASAGHVRALFLSQAGRIAALGSILGAVLSFAAVRWAGTVMVGFGDFDLRMLTAAVAIHTAVVLVAVYAPIRRATRLDPALTLRSL